MIRAAWKLALLAIILLSLPVIALVKGEKDFVAAFLDRHMPYLVALTAAFLGGAGLRQILR